jgi:hypothetical protein
MRFVRKLMLLAVAAAATMALTASSAQALEIATEGTGVHCTAVTPVNAEPFITHGTGGGGCTIKAHSVGEVEFGSGGLMTECTNVFEGRTNELGEGFIYHHEITNCEPFPLIPCDANNDGIRENWILHVNGEHGANGVEARFCVRTFGITFNCHLFLDLSESPLHRYRLSTGGVHRNCEGNGANVRGLWEQEVVPGIHPAIEIRG